MDTNIRIVFAGTKIEPITDPARIVALIEWDDRLIVRAATDELANRILSGISVRIQTGTSEHLSNGATLFKRVWRDPGTIDHFYALGASNHGMSVLRNMNLTIIAPWKEIIPIPLPTFPARAVFSPPTIGS